MSDNVAYLRIRNPIVINMLIDSAEGMYEVHIDELRDMLGDHSASTLDKKEVRESFQRVTAIQEVVEKLKHTTSITQASHKHLTIIPLSSQEQVAVVYMIIDFAYDTANDLTMEPLWTMRASVERGEFHHPVSVEYVDMIKAEMNQLINKLTAIAELRATWMEGNHR